MDNIEKDERIEEQAAQLISDPVEKAPEDGLTEEPVVTETQETVFEITEEPLAESAIPSKKKKKWGTYLLIALLVAALIAQPFVMGAIRGEPVGISGSAINENGELILYYTDGTSQNLGVVVGEDGSDGKSGANGTTTIISSEGSSTLSVSRALRSSVSILCTFVQESRRGNLSTYYSAGSGVIYELDMETGSAFIITNYHVVYDEDSRQKNGIAEGINVYLYGSEYAGMELEATYVGGSMYYDIAVLRVENSQILKNSDALAVSIADSDDVQVGSTAIAVGNAEGEGISVTSGIVSVDSEYMTMTAVDGITSVDYRVMRIDTAVNSGNSGGGLFDQNGCLIGIVNAKIVDDGVENIGYALPSSVVTGITDNIIFYCHESENESVMRPMLGISVIVNDSRAVYDEQTAMVNIVETVSVVAVDETQLGKDFRVDDQLLSISINGVSKEVSRQYQLIDMMLNARVGDVVTFTVLRGGEQTELSVTITEDCLTAY